MTYSLQYLSSHQAVISVSRDKVGNIVVFNSSNGDRACSAYRAENALHPFQLEHEGENEILS